MLFKRFAFMRPAALTIAMYATPTARDFFRANFYPSGPFTRILPPKLDWLWLTSVHVWVRRIIQVFLLIVTDN